MISVLYPKSSRQYNDTDVAISIPMNYDGTYRKVFGKEWCSIPFNAGNFLASGAIGSSISRSDVVVYGTKELNFDEISPVSTRFDALNSFDTFGDYPTLSTGKTENNCHHRAISGTVAFDCNPINPKTNGWVQYPMSLHETSSWGYDGTNKIEHLATMSGYGLGRPGYYTDSTGKKYAIMTPQFWVTFEHHHYWYHRDWGGPTYTLEQARELGILHEEVTCVTPSYIQVPGYPLLFFSSLKMLSNRKLSWMDRELASPFSWMPLRAIGSSSSTSYNLPNIDQFERSLRELIPSKYFEVESKITYYDEYWYDLILAGAKEIKRLDMNNIANLLEIPGMIRLFDKLYNKFIDMSSGTKVYKIPGTSKIIKKASCIYLGIHYGIKLTALDISEIIQTFKDNPNLLRQLRRRVVSYSSATINGTKYNNKSCFRPKAGREITDMRDLTRILGIELSALNAWDLVPWSFVVDWFIPISDILDSCENIARLESTYDLEYLIQTVSRNEQVTLLGHQFNIRVYDRYVTDRMPQFGFTVGNASGLNNHVIEASALIINSVD